jgi:hypothetical protein
VPNLPFEQRRRETTAKLAALMLANAFIFQEQLSGLEEKVRPIRAILAERDFVGNTGLHWKTIIDEINYMPIFKVARDILLSLPASSDTDESIRRLAQRALEIVSKKAALRHDLMGRIYHFLLLEAKYLGTYYTSVPAATLLLKLTLDIDRWPTVNWADPATLRELRIADLACGTGTLLMAASQGLTDNFIKSRASRGETIDERSLTDLHKLIIEEMLHGYDVLPSAVHLTASTLAMLAPETCFHKMHLYSLPMGKMQSGQIYLGSIDYISAKEIQTQLDLMSPGIGGAARAGDEDAESIAPLPSLDVCVMNPPFVRSVGGNLLFGSMPDQRGQMQAELAQRLRETALPASSTAGLGSVFAAIGDRHLKAGGRIALVLPAAVTSGIAWGRTRKLIERGYVLETVIASHDPERWNFSENTELSEVLAYCKKAEFAPIRIPPRPKSHRNSSIFGSIPALARMLSLLARKSLAARPLLSARSILQGIAFPRLWLGRRSMAKRLKFPGARSGMPLGSAAHSLKQILCGRLGRSARGACICPVV